MSRAGGEALIAARIGRHDAGVLKLWNKTKDVQIDLLDAMPVPVTVTASVDPSVTITSAPSAASPAPHLLPIDALCEDPLNPRTEFPEAELDELAEDIRQRGILQPIVVHPADEQGRHCIHFGAKRWRAARRAGLVEVPVVVRDAAADPYAQVAENQKRHGLTPLDLARFIRSRVDAGESHATIAKGLAMDLTSIAHHLTLLELPPEVEAAMKSGRCTAPRTLHELSKLHREAPHRAQALLDGEGEITRAALASMRVRKQAPRRKAAARPKGLHAKAEAACSRLEQVLDQLAKVEPRTDVAGLDALKKRLAGLVDRLA